MMFDPHAPKPSDRRADAAQAAYAALELTIGIYVAMRFAPTFGIPGTLLAALAGALWAFGWWLRPKTGSSRMHAALVLALAMIPPALLHCFSWSVMSHDPSVLALSKEISAGVAVPTSENLDRLTRGHGLIGAHFFAAIPWVMFPASTMTTILLAVPVFVSAAALGMTMGVKAWWIVFLAVAMALSLILHSFRSRAAIRTERRLRANADEAKNRALALREQQLRMAQEIRRGRMVPETWQGYGALSVRSISVGVSLDRNHWHAIHETPSGDVLVAVVHLDEPGLPGALILHALQANWSHELLSGRATPDSLAEAFAACLRQRATALGRTVAADVCIAHVSQSSAVLRTSGRIGTVFVSGQGDDASASRTLGRAAPLGEGPATAASIEVKTLADSRHLLLLGPNEHVASIPVTPRALSTWLERHAFDEKAPVDAPRDEELSILAISLDMGTAFAPRGRRP